jgi:S1-C subfamily serine protease
VQMESLNKQQLVLLMLLVSFVTSIVTGITVVSLLDQAPQGVTQTINQVVEKTIERVVSVEKPVVQKEVTTVFVKEEDLVSKAVANVEPSIVRIKDKKTGALLGLGIAVRADGVVVADSRVLGGTIGKIKAFTLSYNNESFDGTHVGTDGETGTAFFKFATATPPVITLADTASLKAGQSVVAISGSERNTVSLGIISSLVHAVEADPTSPLVAINTTMAPDSLLSGTPQFNLDGQLVAMKTGKDKDGKDILTVSRRIAEALANAVK